MKYESLFMKLYNIHILKCIIKMNYRSNYIDFNDVKGLDNLNENFKERLTCSICEGLICDPLQCPEEHSYCSRCISQWGQSCPLCRKNNFKKSRILNDLLNNLSIFCYYCEKYLPYETYIQCKHKEEDLYEKLKEVYKRININNMNNQNQQIHFHLMKKAQHNEGSVFTCNECNNNACDGNDKYKCLECNYVICKQCYEL